MDRHNVPGITAKDVAAVHVKDLAIQDEYHCFCLTYWVDEESENAYCLIHAPDKESVKDMHRKAHGLVPYEVIEVDEKMVHSFLGRVYDPAKSATANDGELKIFNDPAFRCILAIDIQDKVLINCRHGSDTGRQLVKNFYSIVQQMILKHGGSLIENQEDILASFVSVTNAVESAVDIQDEINAFNKKEILPAIDVRIGISAGGPVTGNNNFFGDAIKTAKRLSVISTANKLHSSALIRDKYQGSTMGIFGSGGKIKALKPEDEEFLNSIIELAQNSSAAIETRLDGLCSRLAISRSNLYRKTASLTGHSPNDFLNEIRLQQALQLIKRQCKNISEISFELGFTSPSYFTKCFKKRFAVLPAEFLKSLS